MMRRAWRVWMAAAVIWIVSPTAHAQQDRQGCEDYPLVTRMDGFYIEGCKDDGFSSYKFNTTEGRVPVEGHHLSVSYHLREGEPDGSGLAIIRNYANAIREIGGKVLYEGKYSGSMQVVVDGREIWLEVAPYGKRAYRLDVVEKEAMEQQVVADAAALLADLDHAGHVVLHGIYFDTDEAVIKPESRAALAEIARLLKDNAGMTVFIVGHTDMSGSFEHNLDLSERRAAAVAEALVRDHGVPADRLTARGVGPLAPVGSNDSEEGRALNRRVELVKR